MNTHHMNPAHFLDLVGPHRRHLLLPHPWLLELPSSLLLLRRLVEHDPSVERLALPYVQLGQRHDAHAQHLVALPERVVLPQLDVELVCGWGTLVG